MDGGKSSKLIPGVLTGNMVCTFWGSNQIIYIGKLVYIKIQYWKNDINIYTMSWREQLQKMYIIQYSHPPPPHKKKNHKYKMATKLEVHNSRGCNFICIFVPEWSQCLWGGVGVWQSGLCTSRVRSVTVVSTAVSGLGGVGCDNGANLNLNGFFVCFLLI